MNKVNNFGFVGVQMCKLPSSPCRPQQAENEKQKHDGRSAFAIFQLMFG